MNGVVALNVQSAPIAETGEALSIVSKLFESVSPNELVDYLNIMCENYVLYAPVERSDIAQKVSITFLLGGVIKALSTEQLVTG